MGGRNMKEKGILGAIAGVGGYVMNCFNEIMVVLAIFMIIDYIIGTMVSLFLKNEHFDKRKGIQGLLKKNWLYDMCCYRHPA
jgi:phage-related holin